MEDKDKITESTDIYEREEELEEVIPTEQLETSDDISYSFNLEEEDTVKYSQVNKFKPKIKRKNLKYVLSILFLIALIVATIVVLTIKYDFGQIMDVVGTVYWRYLFLGLGMILIYILFEAIAMKILLGTIDLRVSLWHNIEYSAIDYYFCAVTPSATGGQPMVMYYMKKDGVPIAETTLVLLINTALFKIVLMTLSIFALIFYPSFILSRPLIAVLFFLGFGLNLFIVIMCFLAIFKRKSVQRLGDWCIKLLHKIKIIKNQELALELFHNKMDDYEKASKLIVANRFKFFMALLANFIQRIAMFSMAFFVYLSFLKPYPELAGHGYFEMMAIQVIVALSVDSLPFPGGVGISEVLYVTLYGIVYGGETMVATALVVTRALSFYIPLLVTMAIFIYKHISTMTKGNRKLKEKKI